MSYSYQAQYARILHDLIYNPRKKRPSRIGDTRGNFVELLRVDLQKEFPLMDIKKIQFSNILHELLWFIAGDTKIKYLDDNNCHIWDDDAYRYYKEKYVPKGLPTLTKEEFLEKVKAGESTMVYDDYVIDVYHYGDLDRVYGKQWREFNGKTDQLQNCINTLKTNPDDRRMIVTAHNPTDLEDKIVGLPSCHNMFQFYTIPMTFEERKSLIPENTPNILSDADLDVLNIPKFYLCTWFNIRSNDFFLGQPYNMASYALLTHIVANIVNMIPKEVVCTAIDCHLYEAHIEAAEEYIERYNTILVENYVGETGMEISPSDVTYCTAKLNIKRKLTSIDDVRADDIELTDYNPQSYIKAPLLT